MMKRLARTEEKLTRSESASLEQFCRAVRLVAAGKSQAAQEKAVEAGLAEIAALCHRLFAEGGEKGGGEGDEGNWRVRQEVESLLRRTRLNLTAAAGTLWIYLDRQAQPWAGVWFEPEAEAVGFNLEAATPGCQFCLLQGTAQKELALDRTVAELGWTTSPDQGTADDWSDLSGKPDEASPSWLFANETPTSPPTPAATRPVSAAGTRQPPARSPKRATAVPPSPSPATPPPSAVVSPLSTTAPVCSRCGNALRPGVKFCDKCGAAVTAPSQTACPQCGSQVRPGVKFCGNCGAKQA